MGDTHDYKYISVPRSPINNKTLLWQNPNVDAGMDNGATIDLTQQNSSLSMNNYTHLIIYWYHSTTYYKQYPNILSGEIMIEVGHMRKCTQETYAPRLILGGWSGSVNMARCIRYVDDKTLACYNGVKCWGIGTMEANKGWIIPALIYGLRLS